MVHYKDLSIPEDHWLKNLRVGVSQKQLVVMKITDCVEVIVSNCKIVEDRMKCPVLDIDIIFKLL